ncbi:glycine C-acetyltransferase [Plantibacter sp. Leaf314]|uniref:glycine C-acetyltransferase n=1 Tax=Plantibacter sp. Leaf314 TaxID=1736333 RepID=UPI0006F809E5|nr:glycine C-acetyltransferase [Plantibacter sp. Leaf314]KQQ49470.1 2-amino-3-ketobutyrate CoA ligase [Plantibacter sp. Leaf314]
MYGTIKTQLRDQLDRIEADDLTKREFAITSRQGSHVTIDGGEVRNFCANNYLGLANEPSIVDAAKLALDEWGYGLASVRFICGTQQIHRDLEQELSAFLGTEDTILFSSCFDANGAVFGALFGEDDAIISDALNHASIIDGIRLSKARRLRYRNRNMADLEQQLMNAADARRTVIVTDGVFSMDGFYAPLDEICDLADRYGALVLVDDSHAVGFVGPGGRGTPELFGVQDRVDILTGTLGKALGGASGGYVSAKQEIVDVLRQSGRPYLFSNSLAPSLVAGARRAVELAAAGDELREGLFRKADLFRARMTEAGFRLLEGSHPIIPVMFDDEQQAVQVAARMLEQGIYVIPFSFPVVPRGEARIRVQISAAHSEQDIEDCVAAFVAARG